MTQDIKLTGLQHQPSAYDSADGTLDFCANAINENGYVERIDNPTIIKVLNAVGSNGADAIFIHKDNYILRYRSQQGNLLWWRKGEVNHTEFPDNAPKFGSDDIVLVTSVGNTLIIVDKDNKHFFLWKNNGYKYLGTDMPEITLRFGLDGEYLPKYNSTEYNQSYYVKFNDTYADAESYEIISGRNVDLKDDAIKIVTDAVLAKVNLFIGKESSEKGRFMFPFFVRFAYRLYDGSLTKHSAPILMTPSSYAAPFVQTNAWYSPQGGNDYAFNEARVYGYVADLVYDVAGNSNQLNGWEDIISSVDVFISAPVYSYDQSGKVEAIQFPFFPKQEDGRESICIGSIDGNKYFAVKKLKEVHLAYLEANKISPPTDIALTNFSTITLPLFDQDKIIKNIQNESNFYFLKSFKLDELNYAENKSFDDSYKKIEVEKKFLQTLETQEVMTDDYDSHDHVVPTLAYNYNGRLNLANLKKKPFHGFGGEMFNAFEGLSYTIKPTMYVEIEEDGETLIVERDNGITKLPYFYYPNTNAKNLYIRDPFSTDESYIKYELTKSEFLNGAFWFGEWETLDGELVGGERNNTLPTPTATRIELPNKLYTSLVNNPLVFPAKGINTIGQTEILGIATAAKALSQGQFGQYPLYCFSKDGVWAMSVKEDGWFAPEQPISREVCVNKDAITQLDGAVLFFTDKGLMLLEGSNVVCISDELDNTAPFHLQELPKAGAIKDIYGATLNDSVISPVKYMKGANMLYDYRRQRVYIQNPKYIYGYVYSLKTKLWATQTIFKIMSVLNAYPGAQATIRYNTNSGIDVIADFSDQALVESQKALLITRPFKLGAPDVYKTIDAVLVRGTIDSTHVKQVLYATRDYVNWSVVYSSTNARMGGFGGTPYKAFRLALIVDFGTNESISNITVNFENKYTHKIR